MPDVSRSCRGPHVASTPAANWLMGSSSASALSTKMSGSWPTRRSGCRTSGGPRPTPTGTCISSSPACTTATNRKRHAWRLRLWAAARLDHRPPARPAVRPLVSLRLRGCRPGLTYPWRNRQASGHLRSATGNTAQTDISIYRCLGRWPGVCRAGLRRLSGGADAGPGAAQRRRLIPNQLNSALGSRPRLGSPRARLSDGPSLKEGRGPSCERRSPAAIAPIAP